MNKKQHKTFLKIVHRRVLDGYEYEETAEELGYEIDDFYNLLAGFDPDKGPLRYDDNGDALPYKMMKEFGLSMDGRSALIQHQEGRCYGCNRPEESFKYRLCVDHNHDRPVEQSIRGALCGRCNAALGYAQDNPITLSRLAKYLLFPPAAEVGTTSCISPTTDDDIRHHHKHTNTTVAEAVGVLDSVRRRLLETDDNIADEGAYI